MSYIKKCKDPFEGNEDVLVNLATGKFATKEVTDFLLNASKIGKIAYEDFVQRNNDDPSAFEKPIKKQFINNFASMGAKVKRIKNN